MNVSTRSEPDIVVVFAASRRKALSEVTFFTVGWVIVVFVFDMV